MQTELQKAHELFHTLKLREAHAIYRRYFDKLPFKPEQAHAKVIGEFVRTLFELNRVNELKFYTTELERWYGHDMDYHIAYQLAYIYSVVQPPRFTRAMELLDQVLANPKAGEFFLKAGILKAYCWETKGDKKQAAEVIEKLKPSGDFYTDNILKVWRAKVQRDAGNFSESESQLRAFLKTVAFHTDWYAFGSANVILAGALVRQGKIEEAKTILSSLRVLFEGRPHRSLERQIEGVEMAMLESNQVDRLEYSIRGSKLNLKFGHEHLELDTELPVERLLAALIEKRFLDKETIIQLLYSRNYRAGQDDSLVYYHIHSLRKQLGKVGLSPDVVSSSERGYRLVPETRVLE